MILTQLIQGTVRAIKAVTNLYNDARGTVMGFNYMNKAEELSGQAETIRSQIVQDNPAIVRIKHPSRTLILGRSQTGKSTLGAQILMYMHGLVDRIIVCAPTMNWQDTWQDVSAYLSECYTEPIEALHRVKDLVDENQGKIRILLLMDDVSDKEAMNMGAKGILSEFGYNAIWCNLSIIVICHKISNVSIGYRENVENLILFNTISPNETTVIANSFSIAPTKAQFYKLFERIISQPILHGTDAHPFIYVCYQNGQKVHNKFMQELQFTPPAIQYQQTNIPQTQQNNVDTV